MSHSVRQTIRKGGVLLAALLAGLVIMGGVFVTEAAPNQQINYQGKLTDTTGVAVENDSYNLRFFLYDTVGAATTSAIWTEEWLVSASNGVPIQNGLFSVMLGSTTPLSSVDFNQTLYLGVEIGSTTTVPTWDGEMSPRKRLGTVPSAFEAQQLGGLATSSFLRSDQADTLEASSSATSLLTLIQNGAGAILSAINSSAETVFSVFDSGIVTVGTSTDANIATSTGLAIYNKDLELIPGTLEELGSFDDGGNASQIVVVDNLAYVADSSDGFEILDISEPADPSEIGSFNDAGGDADGVAVAGRYAYLADASNGLRIIDISNPFNPILVGSYADGGSADKVAVKGNYAYVADDADGLEVIDVSDPTSPFEVGSYYDGNNADDLAVVGNYAYVADFGGGLEIIDISDPTNPFEVGSVDPGGAAEGIAVARNLVYLANNTRGLEIIDISDPTSPSVVGSFDTPGNTYDVAVAGNYAYLADFDSLRVVDISSSTNPVGIDSESVFGSAVGVHVSGRYVYVAASGGGVRVFSAPGLITPTAEIGNLLANDIESDFVRVSQSLTTDGSLNVGTNAMIGGSLTITGTASSSLQGSNTNPALTVTSGYVGIGTTSPYAALSIAGDLALTGRLYDTTATAGNNGEVLLSTGNGIAWTATSTLGSSLFTDGGDVTYLNSLTDVLAIGTTTNIATSTGLAVYNRDIEILTGSPVAVGSVNDGAAGATVLDRPESIVIKGNYAYIASYNDDGVQILDISDPTNLVGVGSVTDGTNGANTLNGARVIAINGHYAYVASDLENGVQVLDISDPTNPVGVGSITDGTNGAEELAGARSIAIDGNYAYVAGYDDAGVQVLDISDPTNPVGVGSIADGANGADELNQPRDIVIRGNFAYIPSFADDGFQILDISDPTNPIGVGSVTDGANNANTLNGARSVVLSGRYAYVTGAADNGVQVLDISDPTNPVGVGSVTDGSNGATVLSAAYGIAMVGKYLYVTSNSENGIQVLDISSSTAPVGVGSITDGSAGAEELLGAYNIAINGNYAYVIGRDDDGVQVLDLGGLITPTAEIGNLLANDISTDYLRVTQALMSDGSLNVGTNAMVGGALTIAGPALYPELKQGLVGHWTFDTPDLDLSSSTSEVKDVSGNSNDGDWRNHSSTTGLGKLGQALEFDGLDDEVIITASPELQLTSSFSVSSWVYSESSFTQNDNDIISQWPNSAPGNRWTFNISTDNTSPEAFLYLCGACGGAGTNGGTYSNTVIQPDTWYHLVGVYDSSAQTVDIYVNGVLDNGSTAGTPPSSLATSSQDIHIGARDFGGKPHWDGLIDDARIYDRVLTDEEIENLYRIGASTTPPALTVTSGYAGIGTSSPYANLSVDGDLAVTGALYDSTAGAGSNGHILLSTGTGLAWTATSTLGSLFTDGGDITYLTSLTDVLAIGTTTNIATSTGLAVYNRDIEILAGDPVKVGTYNTFGDDRAVRVSGDYAYVGKNPTTNEIDIFDISDPTNIQLLGSAQTGSDADELEVIGNLLYVSTDTVGQELQIFDVSNPTNPTLIGTGAASAASDKIFVQGDHVYLGTDSGTEIFDVSDPTDPVNLITVTDTAGSYVEGTFWYTGNTTSDELEIYDIADPQNPTLVGSVAIGGSLRGGLSIDVSGSTLYYGSYDGGAPDESFGIVDISDPSAPVVLTDVTIAGADDYVREVKVVGEHVFFIGGRNTDLLQIYNVASSTNPYLVGSGNPVGDTWGMDVVGNRIYNLAVTEGLVVYDLGGLITPTAEIGNLLANDITTDYLRVSQALTTDGSLNVGTNALIGGSLTITGTASSSLQGTNTNPALTILSGRMGIGTSTPYADLAVDGDIALTGALYDSTAGAGADGDILLSTGTGQQWTATSTLGSLFTDGGDITYLTSLTDVLAIGTTTDIATSTGLAVYNRDIEILAGDPVGVGSITDGANGAVELDGPEHIIVVDDYAYVASNIDDGVQILDISDPTNPIGIGSINDEANGADELDGAYEIAVSGDYAYVVGRLDNGVQVLDISDPTNPTGVGSITDGANGADELLGARSITVAGNYAYIASDVDNGVQVLDISDPTNPTGVGSITDGANGADELLSARSITVSGNYAYVAARDDNGVQVLDISDPTNPTGVGSITDGANGADTLDGARSITVSGDYVYVASLDDNGVQVLDISDPTNPTGVGSITDGANGADELLGARSITVAGNYAYIASYNDNGVQIIDISDPTNPTGVGSLDDLDSGGPYELDVASSIAVSGNYAYVVGQADDGVQVLDLGGLITPTAEIGNLLANDIATDYLRVSQALTTDGSLNVGTNALIGGSLTITGIASSSLQGSNTNSALTILSGRMGIGTSSPYADLAVDGDIALTGALYDSTAGAGSNGDILLTTGTGLSWTATSTLGSLFTDGGNITYLTSLTDVLAIGTSTDIATSTGLAVYNRDIEILAGSPVKVGEYDVGETGDSVTVNGDYAFVSFGGSAGLTILDVSDVTNPVQLADYTDGSNAKDVAIQGNYIYLANGTDGLDIIDISDPTTPIEVGTVDNGSANRVFVSGNYAFVGDGDDDLEIIDISDPTNPVLAGSHQGGNLAFGVNVKGSYAYVFDYVAGLEIVDISDPTNPIEVGSVGPGGNYTNGTLAGNYIYLGTIADGIYAIDISDPTNPISVDNYDDGGSVYELVVAGNYLYVADGADGVEIFDIASSTDLVEVGTATTGGDSRGLDVQGNSLYVSVVGLGLEIFDLGGLITPTAEIGNLLANDISTDFMRVTQALVSDGSLNVGTNAMVGGALTIAGSALYPELKQGLVGHWTFDTTAIDLSSTTAEIKDVSGNGNDGDWVDHATSTVLGQLGQAVAFEAAGGAVSYTREQSDFSTSGDPASATFGSTPTEGNLLVVTAVERSGTSHTAFTISGSGWTKQVGRDTELADINARRAMAVWTKVAGAGEPTTITIDNGTTNAKKILIEEFSGGGPVTWSFQATSSNDTGTGSASPLSTGSTGSVTGPDLLVMGHAVWRNGGGNPTTFSWTNSLSSIVSEADGANSFTIVGAFKEDDTTGTKESEVSWVNADHEASAALTVFQATGGDSPSIDAGDIGSGVQTISFWVKADDTTSVPLINIDGTDRIELDATGEVVATSFPNATVYVDSVATTSGVATDTWHHVLVTDSTGVNASTFEIGTDGTDFFSGAIDDVRVYDRVLTSDEISTLYRLGAFTTPPGLTVTSGYAGIGTSSPYANLSVDGDLAVTGALYDNVGSVGNQGELLLSTGSGLAWTDASNLGSLFTDAGDITYLTSLTDVLTIGTSTDIATSTGLAVYNKDIEILAGSPIGVGSVTDGNNGADELLNARAIAVAGNYAYVASYDDDGVQVLDISDPTNPIGVGSITDGSNGADRLQSSDDIVVAGNYAYVAAQGTDDGIQILDISDPTNPIGVGSITDGSNGADELDSASSIALRGRYAYVSSFDDDGVQVLDISDPTNPIGVGSINDEANGADTLNGAADIAVAGNYAYVASIFDSGVQILDISDPTNPVGVGSITDGNNGAEELTNATGIEVAGNFVYVTGEGDDGVQIIDVSDPTNPVGVGSITDGTNGADVLGGARDITVVGNYAYVATRYDHGVQILDISSSTNPVGVGSVTDGNNGADTLNTLWGIAGSGNYIYVASGGDNGVQVLDLGGLITPTAEIGNLLANDIQSDFVRVSQALTTDGSLNVGTNALIGGSLTITGTASSSLQGANTNPALTILSGRMGIGTSSPYADLAVDGDLALTGALYDSTAGAGSNGDILLSTGTGLVWTSTSTLDAGTLFTDGGDITYLTDLTDEVLAIGTTTNIATSTGLAVYNRDIEILAGNPIEVGSYFDGGSADGVTVDGNYLYVADDTNGLEILDISDPTNPIEVGSYFDGGNAEGVVVQGSYAYVADQSDGLEILDISDPTNPVEIGSYDDGGQAREIFIVGSYLYLADLNDGLEILDISDPTNPVEIGSYDDGSGDAYDVVVVGSYAYVADEFDGLEILDISDPTAPFEVGAFDDTGAALHVTIRGSYAYVADGSNGLEIIDISDPINPVEVGELVDGGLAKGINVFGNYAFVADDTDGLEIIDISDPTSPFEVGEFYDGGAALDVIVSGNYAYVADDTDGLEILDLGGLITPTAEIGNLLANDIQTDFLRVSQALTTDGSLNVGTNAMVGGSLTITGTASSSLQGTNTNPALTILSGRFLIGTTSTTTSGDVLVDGDMALTGALYDSTAGAGSNGDILLSTGTGQQWTATSTIGGKFTDSGDITYLTDSDDVLAIGTTTDIATSTGLAVYNRDIEILPGNPVKVGEVSPADAAFGMAIAGNYAYVASDENAGDEFEVFDISNPTNPSKVGGVNAGIDLNSIQVSGNYAYVGSDFSGFGFRIFDISDPTTPVQTGGIATGGDVWRFALAGNYAYVTSLSDFDDLEIFDISDPTSPTKVGGVNLGSYNAWDVSVVGNYAYLATASSTEELQVFDISDPTSPTKVGGVTANDLAYSITVHGNYAYLGSNVNGDDLEIFDISDPTNPTKVGGVDTGGAAWSISVIGKYAYLGGTSASEEIQIFDVSSSTDPRKVAGVDATQTVYEAKVVGNYLYATGGVVGSASGNLEIFDLGGLITPTAEIGNLLANDIETDFMRVSQALTTDGSLNVGTNAMIGGSLTITGTASSSLQGSNTNPALTILSGRMGIGTSSPYADLAVDGDLALTGALYDSSASAGANGNILLTTGTGVAWTATTTLAGKFTDGGDITYLTDSDDVLAIGTTTDLVASTTGLAVYNRDVEILPGQPRGVGSITDGNNGADTLSFPGDIAIAEKTAYVLGRLDNGVQVIDITDPTNPTGIGSIVDGNNGADVLSIGTSIHVSGNYAYVTSGSESGVQVLDISDPTNPVGIGSITDGNNGADTLAGSFDLAIIGDYAYVVAATDDGVQVLDISDPANPVGVRSVSDGENGASFTFPFAILARDNLVYVLNDTPTNTVQVLDISEPTNPIHFDSFDEDEVDYSLSLELLGAQIVNDYAFRNNSNLDRVEIHDLSSTTASVLAPAIVASISNGENGANTLDGSFASALSGNYLFVTAANDNGLQVLDLGGLITPTAEIGNLLANDIQSDFVRVTQSLTTDGSLNVGTNALIGGSLTITGTASSSLQSGNTNPALTITSGRFLVGTTSTTTNGDVVIDGDLALTGGLYDSTASLGTAGQVLQTTGTSVQWVATSSLGIGGPTLFTDGGDITYLTDLTDEVLAIGTSTNIATSTGLAVYNRDIEILAGDPRFIGGYENGAFTSNVRVSGEYVYVTSDTPGDDLEILTLATTSDDLVKVGGYDFGLDTMWGLDVAGNYVYVTGEHSTYAFHVLDISNPTNPQVVSQLALADSYNGYEVQIVGNYAYISAGLSTNGRFYIYDISDPLAPELISFTQAGSVAWDIEVVGTYAYVVSNLPNDDFEIFDISDPVNPVKLGGTDTVNQVRGIDVSGNFAYLGVNDSTDSLEVIDITNPSSPTQVATIDAGAGLRKLQKVGDYLYVTKAASVGDELEVYDVSSSTNPVKVGGAEVDKTVMSLYVTGGKAYVTTLSGTGDEVQVFDLPGLITPTAEIGNVLANDIESDTVRVTQALTTDGSLNVGGNAMIGGSLTITGTASSSLQSGNTNTALTVLSGYVGIGTTNPYADLTIDGNLALTGGLYDNTGSLGTAGQVLQSTGTGLEWVATSTLDTSPFIDGGDITYLGSLTDTLAVGTTTDIATSTGLAVYNRDIEILAGNPVKVGGVDAADDASTIEIVGDYAYVGSDDIGDDLEIFDVSNPTNPIKIAGTNDVTFAARDFSVAGNYLYVASIGDAGLGSDDEFEVFDITDATNPTKVGGLDLKGDAKSVTVQGSYAFIGVNSPSDDTITIVDISNPTSLIQVSGIDLSAFVVNDVVVRGNYLYTVNDVAAEEFEIYDISDPTNPVKVGGADTGATAYAVRVVGNFAYVGLGGSEDLQIYDISDPTSPTKIAGVAIDATVETLEVIGNYLILGTQSTDDDVEVFDISSSTNPVKVGEIDAGDSVNRLAVSGNYVYAVSDSANDDLEILDLGGLITPTAEIGNLASNQIETDFLRVTQALVSDSLNVNTNGMIGGALTITGTASSTLIDSNGRTALRITSGFIEIGTTTATSGIQIGYGAICVDNDGECSATTTGRISSVSSYTGNSDLAENYFSSDDLEPGEIVQLAGQLSVARATKDPTTPVQASTLGVVSTKPGVLLGFDDTSLTEGEGQYPIALSGRVPVKVSTENGDINPGDHLMLSSTPGTAMRATGTGAVIGIALEAFDTERYYSETYINQYGDDLMDTPENELTLEELAALPAETTPVQSAALTESDDSVLHGAGHEEDTTEVQIGQIVMFVDLDYRYLDEHTLAALNTLLSTTSVSSTESEDTAPDTLFDRLKTLAHAFVDGVLSVFTLEAERVELANTLCVAGTCIEDTDLQVLIDSIGTSTQVTVYADEGDGDVSVEMGGDSGGDMTASTTASTTSTTNSTSTENTGTTENTLENGDNSASSTTEIGDNGETASTTTAGGTLVTNESASTTNEQAVEPSNDETVQPETVATPVEEDVTETPEASASADSDVTADTPDTTPESEPVTAVDTSPEEAPATDEGNQQTP